MIKQDVSQAVENRNKDGITFKYTQNFMNVDIYFRNVLFPAY